LVLVSTTASYSSGGVGVGLSTTTSFTSTSVPFGGQKKLMKSTIETGTVMIPLKHLKVLINHSTILLSTLQAINYYLFHKVNTADDINVKRYCTNCAHKLKPTFKLPSMR
jgi:hypothetical protein